MKTKCPSSMNTTLQYDNRTNCGMAYLTIQRNKRLSVSRLSNAAEEPLCLLLLITSPSHSALCACPLRCFHSLAVSKVPTSHLSVG